MVAAWRNVNMDGIGLAKCDVQKSGGNTIIKIQPIEAQTLWENM